MRNNQALPTDRESGHDRGMAANRKIVDWITAGFSSGLTLAGGAVLKAADQLGFHPPLGVWVIYGIVSALLGLVCAGALLHIVWTWARSKGLQMGPAILIVISAVLLMVGLGWGALTWKPPAPPTQPAPKIAATDQVVSGGTGGHDTPPTLSDSPPPQVGPPIAKGGQGGKGAFGADGGKGGDGYAAGGGGAGGMAIDLPGGGKIIQGGSGGAGGAGPGAQGGQGGSAAQIPEMAEMWARGTLLQNLTQEYIAEHKNAQAELAAHFGYPPIAWMNEKLVARGVTWRVQAVGAGQIQYVEPLGYSPYAASDEPTANK